MPRKRHTEAQIIAILRESEGELTISELCRKYAITTNTFYRWKRSFGGMEVNQARELKQLRDENGKLKKKLAELVVEVDDLRFINSKKVTVRPTPSFLSPGSSACFQPCPSPIPAPAAHPRVLLSTVPFLTSARVVV